MISTTASVNPDTTSATEQVSAAALLKHATAPLHRELDQHPLVRGLLKATTLEHPHQRLLTAFRRAYRQLEPAVLAYQNEHCIEVAPYQARLPSLAAFLGDDTTTSPPFTNLTAAHYWGYRYVLDGSSHGARLLMPKLSTALGASHPALDYWRLLTAIAPDWPSVVASLDAFRKGQGLDEECLAAATRSFKVFINALHEETQP